MTNIIRSNFQDHPFHLVSPSPWPLYTSICLLNLTTSAALSMHNFSNSYYFFYIALLLVVSAMSFWFRDIISEATISIVKYVKKMSFYTLTTAIVITDEEVSQALKNFKLNSASYKIYENNSDIFGYYLAGLLSPQHRSFIGTGVRFGLLSKRNKSSYTRSRCLDLVLWGENINPSSTVRRLTTIELNMLNFPLYQRSVIVGLLLSDAWLTYASVNHKYPRLGFEQTISQSHYVWFVYRVLAGYCFSLPRYVNRTRSGTPLTTVVFTTRHLPCLVEFYDLFYLNKKKVICSNIYDLLTPVALAHFIMGDGSAVSGGLRISTDSFTIDEVVKLINVLIIKYRLKCALHIISGKPRIFISSKSLKLLKSIVDPYLVPSMKYKFGGVVKEEESSK